MVELRILNAWMLLPKNAATLFFLIINEPIIWINFLLFNYEWTNFFNYNVASQKWGLKRFSTLLPTFPAIHLFTISALSFSIRMLVISVLKIIYCFIDLSKDCTRISHFKYGKRKLPVIRMQVFSKRRQK